MSDEKPNADNPGVPEKPAGPPAPDQPGAGDPAPGAASHPTPGAGMPPSVGTPGTPSPPAQPHTPPPPPPRPKRTSEQIRADIDAQRTELGQSVDQLRDRVTELTDWRGQIRKHRKQIIIGAVATGFIVGGLAALRRR